MLNSTVFPAYAGVNLIGHVLLSVLMSIPRVCGGEPMTVKVLTVSRRYSPRMRG